MNRRKRSINILILLLITVIVQGVIDPPAMADTSVQFVDVTQEAGIHWTHH